MVQNPAFDLCEFEKERGVIIQEIRQLNDVPNELVFDMFQEQCFYGKRLGTQILGNEDLITSYGVGDLKRYISAKYSSDRIMICAAGGVVHDQLLDLSNRFVSKMLPFEIEPVEKQEYVGGYIFKKKNLGQTHLVLGFEGLKHTDDNKFSMGVLSNILGGGMSSRLFQEVREKRGLAYSIFSFENRYIDTGVFGIYAACDDNDAKDVIAIVREECEKIRINVEEEELIKAKAQMKASILMGLESSMSRMQRLANQLMFLNEYIPPSEIAKKIDEVNLESVKNIAEKVFRTRFTMAVLGNCADIEKLYDPCT
jgi:predicted Zn-dependent peptidase